MAKQARLREEHRLRYPHLRLKQWYDVVPIFPGVRTRRTDIFGERLTRIATPRGFETFRADHFRFRDRPGEVAAMEDSPVEVESQAPERG